jgi:hypothetical protein
LGGATSSGKVIGAGYKAPYDAAFGAGYKAPSSSEIGARYEATYGAGSGAVYEARYPGDGLEPRPQGGFLGLEVVLVGLLQPLPLELATSQLRQRAGLGSLSALLVTPSFPNWGSVQSHLGLRSKAKNGVPLGWE